MVYSDFFSLRIDDPQFVDAGARVDYTFLIEIEMCGLRRENLDNKIRCSLGSLLCEKAASPLGKEAQVRLKHIYVAQNYIKRRVIDDADALCFEILHHLELDRPRNVLVETIWCRAMKRSPLIS